MNQPPTRLAELARNRHLLAEIAAAAQVSRSFVSQVAAGRKKPSAKVRIAAARVLGVPMQAIFPEGGQGDA